ncbi:MAG: hypothetical protein WD691_05295 [Acidimicrobiales bacterium]
MAKDLYGKGRGFYWFGALALVLFSLYSVAIAFATADKCDGAYYAGKHWELMPPHWECKTVRGFG